MSFESLNILDIGVVMILLMFFIVGVKNGFIKEAFSLVGTVLIFLIAFYFKGFVGNIMCIGFPFFRFSGVIEGMSSINILLYQIIAFMFLFCALLTVYIIILNISEVLQKVVNMTIILIPISKILGGFVSLVKGYIIMFAVFLLLMIPLKNEDMFKNSKLVNGMLEHTPVLSSATGNVTKVIGEVYSLGNKVSNNKLSSNDANVQTIDLMLKYNIVDEDTVKELVRKNKLDNVEGIDKVLEKY